MDELHLLGVHEDGEHLLLATVDDQQRFRLPLTDGLRAAVRWERSSRGQATRGQGEELRPRDVQAMIRAGATAQEAAERANWSVEKVRRFEGPILAERAYMAAEAGRAHVRSRMGTVQLADRVTERFEVRGVSAESAAWDAWRDEDGEWTVEVRFAAGGRQRTASWHFNKSSMTVTARDDEARWLSDDGAEPEPAVQHVVPTRGRVYDVEAEGGLRPAGAGAGTPGATAHDEVSLMTSMRERSTARRRRGQRKSPAASPTALPPLGDAPPVEAPPLAELRYDPETMPPPPAAHGEPETDGIDGRPEPAALAGEHLDPETPTAGFDDDEQNQPAYDAAPDATEASGGADETPAVASAEDDPVTEVPALNPAPEPVAALPPRIDGEGVDEPELPMGVDEPELPMGKDEPGAPRVAAAETTPSPTMQIGADTETEAESAGEPEPRPAPEPAEPTPTPTTQIGADSETEAESAGEPEPRPAPEPAEPTPSETTDTAKPKTGQRTQPARTSRSRRKGRASVPAWDDIVFGAKPGGDE